MVKLGGVLVCAVYLALVPLCFSSSGHLTQEHGAHGSAPSSLSESLEPHAAMYGSVTAAILAVFVFCAILAGNPAYAHRANVLASLARDFSRRCASSRDAPHPTPLFERLTLFTHAPPRSA